MRSEFSERVQFPRDVAGALHRRFATGGSWGLLRDQERAHSPLAQKNRHNFALVRPLPTLRIVRQLLDISFAASLMEEEGRRISFTLGYLSPVGATRLRFRSLRFRQPLPLRPSALAKVALSSAPTTTTLGVWPSTSGDLEIWGLIHHGEQSFAIDLKHQPTYLAVQVLRPGTFTVYFDERLALLFSRDHFYLFEGGFDLLGILRDRAGLEPRVAQDLCRLASRMLAHGHGGTMLVTDTVRPRGLKMHPSFTVKRSHPILRDALDLHERAASGQLRTKSMSDAQYVRLRFDVEDQHDEALDFVAQLSAIDGAVVLQGDLTLRGFGATVVGSRSSMPNEVTLEDPKALGKEKPLPLAKLGGNRHRSAVCFCAQQKSLALALVASQDGDLSLVARRKDGAVHVIRPFEMGVGI